MSSERKQPLLAVILIAAMALAKASAQPQCGTPTATLLVSGLQGALGSPVGPDYSVRLAILEQQGRTSL